MLSDLFSSEAREDSLIAVNQYKSNANLQNIPCYGFEGTEVYHIPTDNNYDIAYYWTANPDYIINDEAIDGQLHTWNLARKAGGSHNVIQRDDDFVVLQALGGWVVWCFDEEVHLPVVRLSSSGSGNALPLRP